MGRVCITPAAGLLFTVALTACAGGIGHRSDTVAENARLAATIKAALVAKHQLNASAIDVQVDGGAVTLGGFVESEAQRAAAENLVRQLAGTDSLTSTLSVR